jgi:hypothetical protein
MRKRQTEVAIDGDRWLINGKPTYEGREYRDWKIEGLLLNSRMIQGIFDDENDVTRSLFQYPDTSEWDPDRNTAEFAAAMPEWRQRGLVGITVGLQGGSPRELVHSSLEPTLMKLGITYDDSAVYHQVWNNSAFEPSGTLKKAYLERLNKIIEQADALGMVVILDLFYWGQDQRMQDEAAIRRGVEEICAWILEQGYTNVVIEIANECDLVHYDHDILRAYRIHELIDLAKSVTHNSRRLLVSTSFVVGVPPDQCLAASDFVLLHGNHIRIPEMMRRLVAATRDQSGYRTMPVVVNEDDHFAFESPDNNFLAAVWSYAGWGLYLQDGYQTVPANWGIDTPLKQEFFDLVSEITGSK